MKCISIAPVVGNITYYILFEIEAVGEQTIYTIADDPQSRLLGLPFRTTIIRTTKLDKTFRITDQKVTVDRRVLAPEQIELCMLLYNEVLQEEKSRPAETKLRPWWQQGGK